jgi:hypothetical protein
MLCRMTGFLTPVAIRFDHDDSCRSEKHSTAMGERAAPRAADLKAVIRRCEKRGGGEVVPRASSPHSIRARRLSQRADSTCSRGHHRELDGRLIVGHPRRRRHGRRPRHTREPPRASPARGIGSPNYLASEAARDAGVQPAGADCRGIERIGRRIRRRSGKTTA